MLPDVTWLSFLESPLRWKLGPSADALVNMAIEQKTGATRRRRRHSGFDVFIFETLIYDYY
jgi:hypothetical protein